MTDTFLKNLPFSICKLLIVRFVMFEDKKFVYEKLKKKNPVSDSQ